MFFAQHNFIGVLVPGVAGAAVDHEGVAVHVQRPEFPVQKSSAGADAVQLAVHADTNEVRQRTRISFFRRHSETEMQYRYL
jgi:hypothetical protein